ncbi:MAG TPA: hypothetical protein VFR62_11765 [Gemmatimonadales bacterium]|nr:hypothetical protein [Gemmatimonadales bacterium]
MSFSFDVFGHDPDPVVHDLEKTAFDGEPTHQSSPTDAQRPGTQERHERRMVRQNADLTIEGGRDYRVGLTIELRRLR